MDVNAYLDIVFEYPPCWQLVAKVYEQELGFSCLDYKTINGSVRSAAAAFRLALHKKPDGLTPIAEAVDLCIVLLGKTPALGLHHCGVYWQGSVLHASEEGTLYQDMSSIGDQYQLIEFWGRA